MTKKIKNYLTSIKLSATERDQLANETRNTQEVSNDWEDLRKQSRAADDRRYILRNKVDTIQLKELLFRRTGAEMDAYHDMSRQPERWSAEEIEKQRIRVCAVWQVIEEAELSDEYEAWKEANPNA